jgi:HK97 gp10 family phage protein
VSISGADRHLRRLRALRSPAARQKIAAALYTGGDEIATAAKLSIAQGSVSGKGHVPSKPGEPPNMDTRHLMNNIETTVTGPLTVEVESKAAYALDLEFGTSKMAERPYMRPATEKKRKRVHELVQKVASSIVRGS